jgi:hypothetical protein
MKKVLLPIVAVVTLAVTGVVLAVALNPHYPTQKLAPMGQVGDHYEGWASNLQVTGMGADEYYWLVPAAANLGAGPLSELRISVDGGDFTTGPWGIAEIHTTQAGDLSYTVTVKCADTEGHALITLFEDSNNNLEFDPVSEGGGDYSADAVYVHGLAQ